MKITNINRFKKVKLFILYIIFSFCSLPIMGYESPNIETAENKSVKNSKQIKNNSIAQTNNKNELTPPVTCYAEGPLDNPVPLNKTQLQSQIKDIEELYKNKKINAVTYKQRKQSLEKQLKDMSEE
ncbi:MAG: hypothetical protein AB1782_01015 [Cyanobacteriota bacterium]